MSFLLRLQFVNYEMKRLTGGSYSFICFCYGKDGIKCDTICDYDINQTFFCVLRNEIVVTKKMAKNVCLTICFMASH